MDQLKEQVEITTHALLYILKKLGGTGDFHKVFKILYFADQKHLVKYGSPISNDIYIAMTNGPVPSMAYDILKSLRGQGLLSTMGEKFKPYFELLSPFDVKAIAEPDMDNFSKSEILALDEAISENKSLGFKKLTDKSHDSAWNKAIKDGEINMLNIAIAGGASNDMLQYIGDHIENSSAKFI